MKQLAVSLLALVACSHDKHPAQPAGPAASADVHPFKIGNLDAMALRDGGMSPPNDGKLVAIGHDPKEVADVLTKAGAPSDHFEFSIQPLLLEDGAHVVLFDTGLGAQGGHLMASLAAAGVAPGAITDIFISHAHLDHIGGLVADGKLAFPNATVHMSAPEWTAMQADDKAKAIAAVISAKVAAFEPGAKVLPEVQAVDTHGHTPGHSSYDISSNGEHLFYTGDIVHNWVISVQRPTWPIGFDQDGAAAMQARVSTLAKLAAEHTRVYAVHFPFPGLGHITGSGENLSWQRE